MEAYKIPIGYWIETFINFFSDRFSFITKAFSEVTERGLDWSVDAMMFFPPWVLILIFTAVAFLLSRKRGVAVFTFIGLMLIWNMGLWSATVSTFALVLVSTLFSIAIGIPLGILAALSKVAYRSIMPILDLMQTMPAFVYLIPAIPFFGLGPVAAIFSTVIFSMPPAIRLTCLGIKQVPRELVEAADAFGSTKGQKLVKLQLPIAMPTIMAGVNQTTMLALSMVVIAAMIGAKGLGGEVWKAIQRLQPDRGFEAGIGIVIVAIILDRILQQFGVRKN
ncbi:MAG TPA: proline/glycine betaine ABC transporter permease [Desulfobacteraceae bacterium]|nr:proline/glycine betaine ABC transporter permease [Deltaproteobacteria bacterium]RLB99206.1 MAG: proline/glycine betaine ABC transporter permease [Deltaproteobacteria bacterium]HDI60765.1 proline/glycine betaine ABC transporter permease [Desulfobacteraceae bacterium]